ncbi:MAG: hypothetical protein ACFFD2_15945 [Promethearchaeota archaeon]
MPSHRAKVGRQSFYTYPDRLTWFGFDYLKRYFICFLELYIVLKNHITIKKTPIKNRGLYSIFRGTHTAGHTPWWGKSIIQDHQYSHGLPHVSNPEII